MSVRKIGTVAITSGLLFALSAAAVGWAQPTTSPRKEQQASPGMMGPGMMPGPMMGDMGQMIQACTQMMNRMMGPTAPPAQPGPGSK